MGRLRGLGLGEGDRFLGLPDLLGGVAERLRGTGERLRGLGVGLRSTGERLRGLGDRLRGLGDRLRWDGECLRGLEERFREEPLRLRSSSFLGDLPRGDLSERLPLFRSLECPLSPRSLRSFFGGGSTFSCFVTGAVAAGAVTASCLGEPSRFGDFPAEDFSLEDASPLASFFSSLGLSPSFLSHLEDSFFESFLSSLERGERDRSRRELRDDLSRLRLLLSLRSLSLSLSRSLSLSFSFSFSLSRSRRAS